MWEHRSNTSEATVSNAAGSLSINLTDMTVNNARIEEIKRHEAKIDAITQQTRLAIQAALQEVETDRRRRGLLEGFLSVVKPFLKAVGVALAATMTTSIVANSNKREKTATKTNHSNLELSWNMLPVIESKLVPPVSNITSTTNSISNTMAVSSSSAPTFLRPSQLILSQPEAEVSQFSLSTYSQLRSHL